MKRALLALLLAGCQPTWHLRTEPVLPEERVLVALLQRDIVEHTRGDVKAAHQVAKDTIVTPRLWEYNGYEFTGRWKEVTQ